MISSHQGVKIVYKSEFLDSFEKLQDLAVLEVHSQMAVVGGNGRHLLAATLFWRGICFPADRPYLTCFTHLRSQLDSYRNLSWQLLN